MEETIKVITENAEILNAEEIPVEIINSDQNETPIEPTIIDGPDASKLEELKNVVFNHRLKRRMLKHQGILKQKNKLNFDNYLKYLDESSKIGKEIHAQNTERAIKQHEDYIDSKRKKLANDLEEKGYSEEKIAEIIETIDKIDEKRNVKKLKKNKA